MRLNGLDNCRFLAGDVFEVLDSLPDKPEVIVVGSARVGISSNALKRSSDTVCEADDRISPAIRKSCGQPSYMQYYGYEIKSVKPFDNFPGTKHTECVAVLEKGKK